MSGYNSNGQPMQYGQQPQYRQQPQYGQPQPQYGQPQQQQQYSQPMQGQPVYANGPPQYGQNPQQGQPMMGQTIVIQQQGMQQFGPFQVDFCSCCDDPCTCIVAFLCPCAVIGQNMELKDAAMGQTCFGGFCCSVGVWLGAHFVGCGPCIWAWWNGTNRTSLRMKHSIAGDNCTDCLLHCCCSSCSLTQEHSELLKRNGNGQQGIALVTVQR